MKLFLSSMGIAGTQLADFLELVGKEPKDIKFVLIESAANVGTGDTSWVVSNRNEIIAAGVQVELLELEDFIEDHSDLHERLKNSDVIWCGGGNTFYLRWLLRQTGADKFIADHVASGKVYGGGSAGAIVAGSQLKYIDALDDSGKAPEVIFEGMNFIDEVILPHWGNEQYGEVLIDIREKLQAEGYKTIEITDSQVLVVEGDSRRIIG